MTASPDGIASASLAARRFCGVRLGIDTAALALTIIIASFVASSDLPDEAEAYILTHGGLALWASTGSVLAIIGLFREESRVYYSFPSTKRERIARTTIYTLLFLVVPAGVVGIASWAHGVRVSAEPGQIDWSLTFVLSAIPVIRVLPDLPPLSIWKRTSDLVVGEVPNYKSFHRALANALSTLSSADFYKARSMNDVLKKLLANAIAELSEAESALSSCMKQEDEYARAGLSDIREALLKLGTFCRLALDKGRAHEIARVFCIPRPSQLEEGDELERTADAMRRFA